MAITFLWVTIYFSHLQVELGLILSFTILQSSKWLSSAPILDGARAGMLTAHRLVKLLFEEVSFTAHLVVLRSRFIY